MADSRAVAENIRLAYGVMQAAYRDMAAVVGILTEGLADDGWRAHGKVKLIGDHSYNLSQPDQWLLGKLYRLYLPESAEVQGIDRVLVVEVILRPPNLEVPVVAVMAARLKRPATAQEFWNSWDWSAEPGHWHTRLADAFEQADPDGIEINGPTLQAALLLADKARLICVELCGLTRENVGERLVKPTLRLLRGD